MQDLGSHLHPQKRFQHLLANLVLQTLEEKVKFSHQNYYDQICILIPLQLRWASNENFEQQISFEIKPTNATFFVR